MSKKRGLGKGLGALMGDMDAATEEEGVAEVDILLLDNNKQQPRKHFDEGKLEELAQSIQTHGIMQPILVYEEEGRFTIVAGERRFRAAKMAGLSKVPVLIKEFTEQEVLELSLIENIQREDLNAIEQAAALDELVENYGLTQAEVASRVGKSRSTITNLMRLLALPPTVKELVRQGELSAGHARALLALEKAKIESTAQLVIQKALSVRQTEALVKRLADEKTNKKPSQKTATRLSPDMRSAQNKLGDVLSTKVRIQGDNDSGKITIEYYNKDQLEHLFESLSSLGS